MAEGYCVKCKAKKPITDAVEEIMKNGRKAIKGRCPTCGTVMFKILGGKATVVAPVAPSGSAGDPGHAPAAEPVTIPSTPSKDGPDPRSHEAPTEEKKPTN
jgi:hypothetical protein